MCYRLIGGVPMNDKKILIPFILITAVTFILNMTTQMTLPTFSVYLKHLEFPVGLIGAASLGIALAAMFFRPVAAILSRKMGSYQYRTRWDKSLYPCVHIILDL